MVCARVAGIEHDFQGESLSSIDSAQFGDNGEDLILIDLGVIDMEGDGLVLGIRQEEFLDDGLILIQRHQDDFPVEVDHLGFDQESGFASEAFH